ncbi:unnamed protein product [Calypogeia fissa]
MTAFQFSPRNSFEWRLVMMRKPKAGKHCGAILCALVTLGFLGYYLATTETSSMIGVWLGTRYSGSRLTDPHECHTPPFTLLNDNSQQNSSGEQLVRELIEDLRERTRFAASSLGGEYAGWDGSITDEQAKEWGSRNPCRSRRELAPMYSMRKYAKDLPLNPFWEEVFQEYSKYHRVCMKAVGDVAEYFKERRTHAGCQFIVADTQDDIGIGNRLQVVANSVFYGIITRRVILLPTSHHVTNSICEAIVGSTWILDAETFPIPPQRFRDKWELSSEVLSHIDKHEGICEQQKDDPNATPPPSYLPYAAGDIKDQKQPFQRFYCPTEQSFYSDITWVYLSGCIYTIPKTFAIPTFRPTLQALFPDNVILTRIFRSFILPADRIWSRVRRLHDTYLQPADRKVGIQMRYLKGAKQYKEMHELVNTRVVDCISSKHILPDLLDKKTAYNLPGLDADEHATNFRNQTRISVLVTSLYLSLHDVVRKMYVESPTVDGAEVNVVQLTHENRQEFGVDVDLQAYTEILLLSMMDDLVLAPVSTFGGSAQAYGALSPWFIEYRDETDTELPSCERSQTVEVCNQYTGKNFDCRYDPELGTKPFSAIVPGMEDCPQIEFPYLSEFEQGVRLRTTFLS